MKNLTPSEIEEWRRKAREMRSIARCNPCYDPRMAGLDDFAHKLGPWNVRLVLETYVKPTIWHGSVSLVKQIGDETVYDKETNKPIFTVPQDAMVAVHEWGNDEYQTARDVLAQLFGPLIHDKTQPVKEVKGQMCLHWTTDEKDARQAAALGN